MSRYIIQNILPTDIPPLQKYVNDLEKLAGMELTFFNPRSHYRDQAKQLKKRAYDIFRERAGCIDPECPQVKYTLNKRGFHRVCHLYPKKPQVTTLDSCLECNIYHKYLEILENEIKKKEGLGLKSF